MKYIHTKRNEFVIFSGGFNHNEVADKFRLKKEDIDGAGFISIIDADKISCYGSSHTLDIKSTERDTELLQRQIRGY